MEFRRTRVGPNCTRPFGMDHRVKPGGDEQQRVKPADDESFRCRDAPSHPSFAYAKIFLSQEKPSQKALPRKLLPSKRREAERRQAHPPGAASKRDAARVLSPSPLLRGDRGPGLHRALDLMERARSPFGAPPRHPRSFGPRLGLGRASWNHRMQTGGPSPAPVQRAPRGPTRAGRDDAQAARERSVSLRPTRTAPAPPQGVPSRRRPS
jgi:hypothetical protein